MSRARQACFLSTLLSTLFLIGCIPTPVGPPVPIAWGSSTTQYFIYAMTTATTLPSGASVEVGLESWKGVDSTFVKQYEARDAATTQVSPYGATSIFLRRGNLWRTLLPSNPYRVGHDHWDEVSIPVNFRSDSALTFLFADVKWSQDVDKSWMGHVERIFLNILDQDSRTIHQLELPAACDKYLENTSAQKWNPAGSRRIAVILHGHEAMAIWRLPSGENPGCDANSLYSFELGEKQNLPADQLMISTEIYLAAGDKDGVMRRATRSHEAALADAKHLIYFDGNLPKTLVPGAVQQPFPPTLGPTFGAATCDLDTPVEFAFACAPSKSPQFRNVLCTYHGAELRTFVGLLNGSPMKTSYKGCEEIGLGK